MMFSEARLENIGPIRRAAIGDHRLTVFVGPNCSGKSIAARLLHAARRLGLLPDGAGAGALAGAVLRGAGIEGSDAVTHSMPSGRIELVGAGSGGGAVLDFGRGGPQGGMRPVPPAPAEAGADGAGERSVYVPAGRAAMIQSLLALVPAGGGPSSSALRLEAPAPLDVCHRMPGHLAQFCRIALEALSGGLDGRAQEMFSRVFRGSIKAPGAPGIRANAYADPLGFEAGIGSAASGVASAFPIMVALNHLDPAGMLVVEDPEEHIEPIRQIKLVGEMVKAASARGINMVVTTHSPFVAHAVLGLVGSGAVGPEDLGMYYFRRRRGSYTDVERIRVNGAGEAEQELFDEAIDALAYGSVVPNAP